MVEINSVDGFNSKSRSPSSSPPIHQKRLDILKIPDKILKNRSTLVAYKGRSSPSRSGRASISDERVQNSNSGSGNRVSSERVNMNSKGGGRQRKPRSRIRHNNMDESSSYKADQDGSPQKTKPFLTRKRLEAYLPKPSWFERRPTVDRIVGLTIHCFALSMVVLVRAAARCLVTVAQLVLFMVVQGALERGQLTIASLSRDQVQTSTLCKAGNIHIVMAKILDDDNVVFNQHHQQQHHHHQQQKQQQAHAIPYNKQQRHLPRQRQVVLSSDNKNTAHRAGAFPRLALTSAADTTTTTTSRGSPPVPAPRSPHVASIYITGTRAALAVPANDDAVKMVEHEQRAEENLPLSKIVSQPCGDCLQLSLESSDFSIANQSDVERSYTLGSEHMDALSINSHASSPSFTISTTSTTTCTTTNTRKNDNPDLRHHHQRGGVLFNSRHTRESVRFLDDLEF